MLSPIGGLKTGVRANGTCPRRPQTLANIIRELPISSRFAWGEYLESGGLFLIALSLALSGVLGPAVFWLSIGYLSLVVFIFFIVGSGISGNSVFCFIDGGRTARALELVEFSAGGNYCVPLATILAMFKVKDCRPVAGLGIGERLAYYTSGSGNWAAV